MKKAHVCFWICTGLAIGCDRRHEPAPPAPTTRVAVTPQETPLPATQPHRPTTSVIGINGQSFEFPPAKLVLKKMPDGVRATFFSDDPPEALKDNYQGNSFYFDVSLDADSVEAVSGQQFVFRNSAGERAHSTTGLFIAGAKQVLQPLTAALSFDSVDGQLEVSIRGKFQLFDDQTPDEQAVSVSVQGLLVPQIVTSDR